MAKSHLKLVMPTTKKRTVTPRRRRNGDLRTREYLTEAEVERLMKAATGNRHGHRDATMILVAYRHGLRVSELVDLRWDQVDFRTATLHVRRAKQGTPSTHRSSATNCEPCGGFRANRSPHHLLYSRQNEERRSQTQASPGCSNELGPRRSLALSHTRTC